MDNDGATLPIVGVTVLEAEPQRQTENRAEGCRIDLMETTQRILEAHVDLRTVKGAVLGIDGEIHVQGAQRFGQCTFGAIPQFCGAEKAVGTSRQADLYPNITKQPECTLVGPSRYARERDNRVIGSSRVDVEDKGLRERPKRRRLRRKSNAPLAKPPKKLVTKG